MAQQRRRWGRPGLAGTVPAARQGDVNVTGQPMRQGQRNTVQFSDPAQAEPSGAVGSDGGVSLCAVVGVGCSGHGVVQYDDGVLLTQRVGFELPRRSLAGRTHCLGGASAQVNEDAMHFIIENAMNPASVGFCGQYRRQAGGQRHECVAALAEHTGQGGAYSVHADDLASLLSQFQFGHRRLGSLSPGAGRMMRFFLLG